jgi:hypothetical protein
MDYVWQVIFVVVVECGWDVGYGVWKIVSVSSLVG